MAQIYLIIGIIFLALIVMMVLLGIAIEYIQYNKGICPSCGGKLRLFANDVSGIRGYTCDQCQKYTVWISNKHVDGRMEKSDE